MWWVGKKAKARSIKAVTVGAFSSGQSSV